VEETFGAIKGLDRGALAQLAETKNSVDIKLLPANSTCLVDANILLYHIATSREHPLIPKASSNASPTKKFKRT